MLFAVQQERLRRARESADFRVPERPARSRIERLDAPAIREEQYSACGRRFPHGRLGQLARRGEQRRPSPGGNAVRLRELYRGLYETSPAAEAVEFDESDEVGSALGSSSSSMLMRVGLHEESASLIQRRRVAFFVAEVFGRIQRVVVPSARRRCPH